MNVRYHLTAASGGLLALLLVAVSAGREAEKPRPPQPLAPEEALAKARVDGKYAMLLRQIKVEKDFDKYGAFRDLGGRTVKDYAGFKDLPAGSWVYVYPNWYIWRDLAESPTAKRNWGPEQATGPPDTAGPGDLVTAWASAQAAGQMEWLLLEYPEPLLPSAVLVHETYNPGALVRVTAFRLDGEEVEVWKGKDPTAPGSGKGVSEVALDMKFKTNRIKIYIDSQAVPGWNEIDAVGLKDGAGKTHWASSAAASSTYAELGGAPPGGAIIAPPPPAAAVPAPPAAIALPPAAAVPAPAPPAPAPVNKKKEAKIKKLEEELKTLQEKEKEIEAMLKELKGEDK
jgi:hypothetical protein